MHHLRSLQEGWVVKAAAKGFDVCGFQGGMMPGFRACYQGWQHVFVGQQARESINVPMGKGKASYVLSVVPGGCRGTQLGMLGLCLGRPGTDTHNSL